MQEIIDKQGIVYKSIGVGKLEVVGYKGLDFYLEIPSRYKLQKVVSIGTYAFDQSPTLTTVTIPDTVEKISGSVFVRCPNLECISVDAKNPKYRSLDGNLYTKNCTELIQYAVGKKNAEFTLPDTVDLIQIYAFWGNTNLKKILVGKKSGFISIDGNLYSEGGQMLLQYACGKTDEEFFIPNGITKIAHCCFSHCKSLKKVIIPNTVEFIGHNSFQECTNLEEIIIPSSVKEIQKYAFWGCKNLKTVYNLSGLDIKKGDTENGYVGYYAEKILTTLEDPDFKVDKGKLISYKGKGGNVVIPSYVSVIGEKAFYFNSSITSITIPNSVKDIEYPAFDGCTGLKKIFIPASVENIDGPVFIRCTNLEQIEVDAKNPKYCSLEGNLYLKDGTQLIQYAVGKKDSKYLLPKTVSSMKIYAFFGNTNLKEILVEKKGFFVSIDGNLYSEYGKLLLQYACGKTEEEFTIPNGVRETAGGAFSHCKYLKKVNVPDSVESIGYNSFQECTSLEEIVIPASVKEIQKNAFWGCNNLKTVYNLSGLDIKKGDTENGYVGYYAEKILTILEDPDFKVDDGKLISYKGKGGNVVIPSYVSVIGGKAFYFDSSITSITIPNSVKDIEYPAFDGCTGLKKIFIPASVENIDGPVFIRCTNLEQIEVDAKNPKYCSIEGNLYLKDGTQLIQYAVGKKDSKYLLPKTVSSMRVYAFFGNTNLKEILVEKEGYFVSIDGNLYSKYGKKLLQYACGKTEEEFTIPNGVRETARGAFSHCKYLKKVNVPDSVESIGYNSFQECTSLEEIIIPSSVKEIQNYAFWGCKNLKTVYNLSGLDIKKGADTHGYVAKYAEKVFDDLPSNTISIFDFEATPERVLGNNFKVAGEILVSYLGYEDVVVIPSGIKAILKDAFKGKNLSILVIPQSVMLIEEDAFAECYALSEVIFEPDSKLVKLGEYAFYKCTELKAINLPKSVEKGNAFVGCDKLLLC